MVVLLLLPVLGALAPLAASAEVLFPRPPSLQAHVTFWKRVYTEFSLGEFVLHDRENLAIIYEVVRVEEHADQSRAARLAAPAVERLRRKYQGLLQALASGRDPAAIGPDAVRVAAAFRCPCTPSRLGRAAANVRVQQGLRERVTAGLRTARQLLPRIVAILHKHRLPIELAAIPLVESSFNPQAQSKVAAVGLWQFMRSTGRQYLTITRRRDDRRDPIRATEAAAHLLRDNYEALGSWPLAIVAYNHGAGGMRAARRTVGSGAIDAIIAAYTGPRFGFASRNFYPEFLAALDILLPLLRTHAPAFELRHVHRGEQDAIEIPLPLISPPTPAPVVPLGNDAEAIGLPAAVAPLAAEPAPVEAQPLDPGPSAPEDAPAPDVVPSLSPDASDRSPEE